MLFRSIRVDRFGIFICLFRKIEICESFAPGTTSARLVPNWRALHVTFLTPDFWSCLRRAPFCADRKGRKSRLRRGIPISPALTIHPLKRPRRGNCDSPFLELPPSCSTDNIPAAGPYSVTAPPHQPSQRISTLSPGGTSNRGAAAPLIGRFKGWGVGAGEIGIPRPDPSFPPLSSARKRGRRRHGKKTDPKRFPWKTRQPSIKREPRPGALASAEQARPNVSGRRGDPCGRPRAAIKAAPTS